MRSKPMRGYLGGVREEIAISACDDCNTTTDGIVAKRSAAAPK